MHGRRRSAPERESFEGFEMEGEFLRGNVFVLEGAK